MNIELSQIFLIGALIIFIIYVFLLRTLFLDRLVLLVITASGIVLVIYPDLASWIANRLGIGRGTDLLLYLLVVAGLFFAVTITSEIKRLQRQVTELVRYIALSNPLDSNQDPGRVHLDAADEGHPDT
jgi:small membrane protein